MSWREVPLRFGIDGFAERPVVGGEVIAVAYAHDVPDARPTPVVDVLDIDGSPGFTLQHECVGRAIESCEPCIDEDRRIVRCAVYEHDLELVVHAAYTDGQRLPRTSLGSDYPISASDLGSKLRTQIAACPDGGFLVTYCYRAYRYFVGKYRDGFDEPAWTADEWLIAATRDHALCAEQPESRGKQVGEGLACRRKTDGAIVWQLGADRVIELAATLPDAFLLVDRTDRHRDKRTSDESADRGFLAEQITEEELERAWDRAPTSPTLLLLVDAATGYERARFEVPDDVFSAHASPDGTISVMTSDLAGRGRLWTNRAKSPLEIRGHASSSWPPHPGAEPVIVGHVDDRVVWADAANVHATLPGSTTSETLLALPTAIGGFRPRRHDRGIAKPNAAIAAGHIYLRGGSRLWIAELL